jgi:glutamine amidotransferase
MSFDAAIPQDNIFGAQFHPEKSHKFGMQIFKNFVNL